jgi:hypothetical protein
MTERREFTRTVGAFKAAEDAAYEISRRHSLSPAEPAARCGACGAPLEEGSKCAPCADDDMEATRLRLNRQ